MRTRILGLGLAAGMLFSGCGEQPGQQTAPVAEKPAEPKDEHSHDHDHDHGDGHPTEGPHHGSLIELGDEEYHGELIHDEKAETVTIYILDKAAKSAVPIEATEVTINLKHDGKPEQFKLQASPTDQDPEGKSSRFVSSDKELAHHLDHKDSGAQLVVTIASKQYRGAVAHDHDHDHKH